MAAKRQLKGRPALLELFMRKVRKDASGCWVWVAHVGTSGYGELMVSRRKRRAPRVAYELFKGQISDLPDADYRGTCVLHTCDNRLCVNPAHLYLGTHSQNMKDKQDRDRFVSNPLRGSAHQNSKLTEEDVVDIRWLKALGARITHIAREYGVSHTTLHRLFKGDTWQHV